MLCSHAVQQMNNCDCWDNVLSKHDEETYNKKHGTEIS